MNRAVEWAKQALKTFSRLDKPTQKRILDAVDELAGAGRSDVRRFEGRKEKSYRLRVGGWRLLFSYLDDGTLLIQRIRPRGGAYKR